MATYPYEGTDPKPPRRGKPKRRRGIGEALRELFSSEGVGYGASKAPTPPTPAPVTARDLGVETDFPRIARPTPKPPTGADLMREVGAPRDVTATPSRPSGVPATEQPAEVPYRDPMGVAQARGELQRIATGRKPKRDDGTDYTPEEREYARTADIAVRARIDREEAKGEAGRRFLQGLSLGGVNAPLQRDINEARREGNLVTEEDLRALDVRTRDDQRLRTEPTFTEGLKETAPEMAGELPWYLPGTVAAEGRLIARAGSALARRGGGQARSIGEALGRIGRDEVTATSVLGRAGQRAARGSVQGAGVGAGLSVARRAQEGETAEEIAAALPLETAIGSGMGAVIDPLTGAAFDVGRGIVRARRPGTLLDAEIARTRSQRARDEAWGQLDEIEDQVQRAGAGEAGAEPYVRPITVPPRPITLPPEPPRRAPERLEDFEIPTGVGRQLGPEASAWQPHPDLPGAVVSSPETERVAEAARVMREMQSAPPRERFNAVRQMEAAEAIDTYAGIKERELATRDMEIPLDQATAEVRERATAPEPDVMAVDYRDAVDRFVAADLDLREAGSLGKPTDKLRFVAAKARDALNVARKNYGQQAGVAAIAVLAAQDDDLTDEERAMIGLGAAALTIEDARQYARGWTPEFRRVTLRAAERALAAQPDWYVDAHDVTAVLREHGRDFPELMEDQAQFGLQQLVHRISDGTRQNVPLADVVAALREEGGAEAGEGSLGQRLLTALGESAPGTDVRRASDWYHDLFDIAAREGNDQDALSRLHDAFVAAVGQEPGTILTPASGDLPRGHVETIIRGLDARGALTEGGALPGRAVARAEGPGMQQARRQVAQMHDGTRRRVEQALREIVADAEGDETPFTPSALAARVVAQTGFSISDYDVLEVARAIGRDGQIGGTVTPQEMLRAFEEPEPATPAAPNAEVSPPMLRAHVRQAIEDRVGTGDSKARAASWASKIKGGTYTGFPANEHKAVQDFAQALVDRFGAGTEISPNQIREFARTALVRPEGEGFFRSRLREWIATKAPKAYDRPTPAAEWIQRVKNSGGAFVKSEAELLLPRLEDAKERGVKLTRADVLALADEVLPILHRSPRVKAGSLTTPAAQATMMPLPEIERGITEGAVTIDDVDAQLTVRREHIRTLQQRRNDLATGGEALVEARDRVETTESEMNQRYERATEWDYWGSTRVRDSILETLADRLNDGYSTQRAVNSALEDQYFEDIPTPDYNPLDLIHDDYTVNEGQREWIIMRPARSGLFGGEMPAAEVTRIPGVVDEETGVLDASGNPDTRPREITTVEEAIAEYRRRTGDTDEVEAESERYATITRDDEDDKEVWRGEDDEDDIRSAAYDIVRDNDLDEEIRNDAEREALDDLRDRLREYADAYREHEEATGDLANREDAEPDEDETALLASLDQEMQRVKQESERLRQVRELAPAERRLQLTATTDTEDRWTRPLPTVNEGRVKWDGYQRVVGGAGSLAYYEVPVFWMNGPRSTAYIESHGFYDDRGNMMGHTRADVYRIPADDKLRAKRLDYEHGDENLKSLAREIDALREQIDIHQEKAHAAAEGLARAEREHGDELRLIRRDNAGDNLTADEAQRLRAFVARMRAEGTDLQNLASTLRDESATISDLGVEEDRLYQQYLRGAEEPGAARESVYSVIEIQSKYSREAGQRGVLFVESEADKAARLTKLDAAKKEVLAAHDALAKLKRRRQAMRRLASMAGRVWDEAVERTNAAVRMEYHTDKIDYDEYAKRSVHSAETIADTENPARFVTREAERQLIESNPALKQSLDKVIEWRRKAREFYDSDVFEQARRRVNVAGAAVDQLSSPPGQSGVPKSPFLGGSFKKQPSGMHDVDAKPVYRMLIGSTLLNAADGGHDRIAISDAESRIRWADMGQDFARRIYNTWVPEVLRQTLDELGFKNVPVEHIRIKGAGFWSVKLTPEIRAAIRRAGFSALALMALAAPSTAEAQETGRDTLAEIEKRIEANMGRLGGVAVGGLVAGLIAWLRKSRAARLTVAANPKLRAAHRAALRVARKYHLRPDFAFQRREPVGSAYDAPIDVAETPSGKGPALFNVAKMGLTPEGEKVWRTVVEDLHLKKRYVSWDQTVEAAKERVPTIEDLLHERPWQGTDALAARMFQSQSAQRLAALAAQLPRATPDEQVLIRAEMDRVTVDIADIAARAAGERERAGRTLNTYKIIAKHTMDEATWQTLAQRAKLDIPLTTEEILKVRSLVHRNDRAGLTTFISSLHTSTTLDKWLTFWKAGMLTGLGTHAVNMVSNAAEAGLIIASQPTAVAVDALIALTRGTLREKTLPRGWLTARLKGLKQGGKEAGQVMRTGLHPDEIGKWDVKRTNYDSPILQAYTQTVFRLLGASDRVFYNVALEAALDEMTTLVAHRAVRSMPKGALSFDAVYAALRADPPNEIAARAAEEATRAVFQNNGTLARMIGSVMKTVRDKGGAARLATETAIPFTRTPANIAQRFVDTSPLGLVTAVLRQIDDAEFDQRRFSEDIARALTGTGGLMLLGYWLAERGEATGSAPTNASQREVWRAGGKRPHSLKIGGRWYSAARVGPPGMTIAAGAQLYALQQEHADKTGAEKAYALAMGMTGTVGRVMLDQSFLLGVSRALETVADPLRQGESFMSGVAASLVPALVGRAAQASDPLVREATGPVERVQSRIPGLSRKLRPALNAFGEPMERTPTDRAIATVDPFYSERVRGDESTQSLLSELERLGVGLPRFPKHRSLTDPKTGESFRASYTDEERHDALLDIGPRRRQFLENLMFSDNYANMPDQIRAREIRKKLDEADESFFARDDRQRIAGRRSAAASAAARP